MKYIINTDQSFTENFISFDKVSLSFYLKNNKSIYKRIFLK